MKPYGVIVATAFIFALTLVTAHALRNSVRAEVGDDGSVVIEGVRYKDAAPLKVALKKLEHRHADIHIWAKPSNEV